MRTNEPDVTEAAPAAEDVRGFTFADGFQFGCGFMAATGLALLILILLIVLLGFVFSLLGLSLFDLGGGLGL